MSTDKLSLYQDSVRRSINALTEVLAYISVGDYAKRPDVTAVKDSEFEELFYGFELLLDDLAEARREVEEQNRFNRLRAEIWKCASTGYASEKDLMQKLLDIIGPEMHVSRASYFGINRKTGIVTVECQWLAKGISSTIGLEIPYENIAPLEKTRIIEIKVSEIKQKGHTVIAELMDTTSIGSMLGVTNGVPGSAYGFFTFSDADQERKWTVFEKSILGEMASIVTTKTGQIKAEEELRQTNIRLEEDVRKRTAELDRKNIELQKDIEKRKKTEKELRESEEKFRSLAEKSPNMIFINQNGKIVYTNERCEEVMGYPREFYYSPEFTLSDIIAPESMEFVIDNLRRHIQGEEIPSYEYTLIAKDGRRIQTIHSTRLIKYGGRPAILGIVTDITDKKKLEEELIRASKLESLGLLAGGIAHDFNNILTGIITNIFIARMDIKNESDAYQVLTEAEKAAYRASRLTKQLLTFSKGGAPVKEIASIKEIIEDTVSFCLSGSKSVYRLNIADDLRLVEIDKGQIDQVLNNLVINADQAMPAGGSIEVRARNCDITPADTLPLKPGPYVAVSITDTGTGIPSELAQKIFDPYFTTKQNGTGLGLTTAYSIINKHDGHLGFRSTPGSKTTFTFYLPACDASKERKKPRREEAPRGKGKILVMDDDDIVRRVIVKLLCAGGFDIIAVSNSADALNEYRKARESGNPFQAAILDLTIAGGKGGKETVSELLQYDPQVKAIAASGYVNDHVMANYRDYGFCGRIVKPFTVEELADALKEVMERG